MTMLLLLLACSEYDVNFKSDDGPPFDTGDGVPDTDTDGDTDGDTDTDPAGTCASLSVAEAGAVGIDATCVDAPSPADPWAFRIQWQHVACTAATPAIGNLDDDDGDGDIDGDDIPDVVVPTVDGTLALDGATGRRKWQTWERANDSVAATIADVDADGSPDILVESMWTDIVALEADGTEKWRSPVPGAGGSTPFEAVDLEGDGIPEVVHGYDVLDGRTGDRLFRLGLDPRFIASHPPAVGDVDRDGDQEIFVDGHAFDSDGTPLWAVSMPYQFGNSAMLVQADGDDEGEIAFVSDVLVVADPGGDLLTNTSAYRTDQGSGAAAAGDFDGDGQMEIVVPTYNIGGVRMLELDGTLVWESLVALRSYGAGVSGFDFDGDGALEVVYPADEALYVLDGRTGDVLFTWEDHEHSTYYEYAVVADVDRDGHAEIVLSSLDISGGCWITALEHDGEGWPAAGPTWGQYQFRVTDLHADGSVPAAPEAPWLEHEVWRARPARDRPPANLVVEITDVCVASCDEGPVQVAVQVGNVGADGVPAGAGLSLYAVDAGSERLVATRALPAVPAGAALAGVVFELAVADIGARGFRAVVDAAGAVDECAEDDNSDTYSDVFCP